MWRQWRPDIVDDDLKRLASAGLQVLRVFPLWPDFQPLTALGTGHAAVELRHGEQALADDDAGRAGVSIEAMQHFAEFANMADQHGLKLIVGLITGWMSGRLFAPPALEGRNVLTDPAAILWQTRFVKYFVQRFREHPAILAWDLGNECNVMGPTTREQSWVWTSAITNAIRAEDASRPVVSGMHSLTPDGAWRMQDQGELTDVLTTHPYPYFTPYCDQDPVNTIRTILHSTCESRFYGDIGAKPCLVEEIGTLGPMVASEAIAADFIRATLFSNWAHDNRGLLWWCAFDLGHLSHAPYDWDAYERELGLIRQDGTPRPVLGELNRFRQFVDALPVQQLPPRQTEAVCILSEGQDTWAIAYSTFVLTKQAGFDLVFQYADQPLKDASFYLMPCISGGRILYRRRWLELLKRVEAGATLYVSHDNGMLSPLTKPFGFDVLTRARRTQPAQVQLDYLSDRPAFTMPGDFQLRLSPTNAVVLGREQDGNPVFTRASYGQGNIYFLSLPMEKTLTTTPGAFHAPNAQPYWLLYAHMAQPFVATRAVNKDHPMVGITEHVLDANSRVIVMVNYSPEPLTSRLNVAHGWSIGEAWYGRKPDHGSVRLDANDAAVFTVTHS